MPIRKTVTVRLSDERRGYVESLGKDFTAGLNKIIDEHMSGSFWADVQEGIDYLRSFARSIEFREPESSPGL